MRVLIVEDENDDLDSITEAAKKAGLKESMLTVVRNEVDADTKIREPESFDLAVVDLCLSVPEKSDGQEEGFRVISQLHKTWPNCRIIAKSTKRNLREARYAVELGAHDIVSAKWEEVPDWKTLLQQRLSFWRRMVEPAQ